MSKANQEQTFLLIKPDGIQRGLIGEIIQRFESKGFQLIAIKLQMANDEILRKHYQDLIDRPFFPKLIEYMKMGPIVPMVWQGMNVVRTARQMLGETNPLDSRPGTIRGDFCLQTGRNIIHGSDSIETAKREINLWFQSDELIEYNSSRNDWIYE
ncbi:Nucleoside diphosphate kinase A [Dermatophagoides pteronyssinus]|uniref:Nucleoside diphosphate kinase n=1 Tax=Dermatophagoides pteronyssinus TaxID=6956 RepID=A0ABQ8JG26_DERPT|nr:Nucleoside diphosphate kinase A [Dermatophagoides pteronyssinus]